MLIIRWVKNEQGRLLPSWGTDDEPTTRVFPHVVGTRVEESRATVAVVLTAPWNAANATLPLRCKANAAKAEEEARIA